MAGEEPANLREWRLPANAGGAGRLFTCGRPGRATLGRERKRVDDRTIDLWVRGLPEAEDVHIVSLLGKKRDGFSEFGYYPFRSSKELGCKPTWQQWLDERYGARFVVHEYPTVDAQKIPHHVLEVVKRRVLDLTGNGSTVVVVDSAGAERTARVCQAICE